MQVSLEYFSKLPETGGNINSTNLAFQFRFVSFHFQCITTCSIHTLSLLYSVCRIPCQNENLSSGYKPSRKDSPSTTGDVYLLVSGLLECNFQKIYHIVKYRSCFINL
jgi:hypothetical protein